MDLNKIISLFDASQHPGWSSFLIQLLIALVIFVLGIVVERKKEVSRFFLKKSLSAKQNGSPRSSQKVVGGDLTDKSSTINVDRSPGATVNVVGSALGTEKEALDKPPVVSDTEEPLGNEQKFIYDQITNRFGREFFSEDEYIAAENYKKNLSYREAATLYSRLFSPLPGKLDEETSFKFKKEIWALEAWVSDGNGAERIEDIIKNIERILYQFFAKPQK